MNNLVCISDCHLGYRHRFKAQRLHHYLNAFNDAIGGSYLATLQKMRGT